MKKIVTSYDAYQYCRDVTDRKSIRKLITDKYLIEKLNRKEF